LSPFKREEIISSFVAKESSYIAEKFFFGGFCAEREFPVAQGSLARAKKHSPRQKKAVIRLF
jgi:hypothetical protein